jgi:hypothetical protein
MILFMAFPLRRLPVAACNGRDRAAALAGPAAHPRGGRHPRHSAPEINNKMMLQRASIKRKQLSFSKQTPPHEIRTRTLS